MPKLISYTSGAPNGPPGLPPKSLNEKLQPRATSSSSLAFIVRSGMSHVKLILQATIKNKNQVNEKIPNQIINN